MFHFACGWEGGYVRSLPLLPCQLFENLSLGLFGLSQDFELLFADVPLDALANQAAKLAAWQRVKLDAVTLETMSVHIAVALGRPRRQSILLDLLQGESDALNDRKRTVVPFAKFREPRLDALGDQTAGRIVVAELIQIASLPSPGGVIDVREAAIDLRKRRHALADDDGHIVVAGLIPDDAR